MCMIQYNDDGRELAKENSNLQSPFLQIIYGELLDQAYKSAEQLVAPVFAIAKVWSNWPSLNTGP